ncbi:peptidylprolyl isomerase [Spirosoma montaniterrae]|uniref:Peptidyl-prolyl cis-trans isomerase n=1 Tax=Spirosoma montaniterrae TaxID=1178516 RepID=A0A1P9X0G7_9BACT|nr:peptidylprolyl isomerase [Spirosoma montaniterrae]AQG81131.1 peptidylprolyl isomerase [Spirosoma montaniterrae]
MKKTVLLLFFLLPFLVSAQNRKKKDFLVTLTTKYGPMRLVLYDQTPKHKENFIRLTNERFYDSLLFHRVIQGFMIQGGDPGSRMAQPGQLLGDGENGYKVPAEIVPELFHKKGTLAAARDNNPEKASSGCQFYIVQGRTWTDDELQQQIERGRTRSVSRVFTDAQKQTYKTLGGTPHLDGTYTVFGEVVDGLAVVDSIAKQPGNSVNRPLQDIRMGVSGKWVKKKKITKRYGYKF